MEHDEEVVLDNDIPNRLRAEVTHRTASQHSPIPYSASTSSSPCSTPDISKSKLPSGSPNNDSKSASPSRQDTSSPLICPSFSTIVRRGLFLSLCSRPHCAFILGLSGAAAIGGNMRSIF
ncbi:hypothetical protein ABVK25_001521 [Lepraria finkii]|uniref:Uncharacterized protein n=1 Tax=Lepraria finkii TaxID=1340010 RepID=A0ABR4BMA7_9LECA